MKRRIVISIIILLLLGTMAFSFYHILGWINDNQKTNELIEKVQEEVYDSETEKIDFPKLKEINNEVVGWIKIEDTNIDYPIVKHSNNSYYLNHSFDYSINEAGWIFLDYRNDLENLSFNTIIYAHGRVDGSMFGSLKDIYNKEYFTKDKHLVYLYTPKNNYIFEVFSFYIVKTTNDYLDISFQDSFSYTKFIKMIQDRSSYPFSVDVLENDKIITLSTCYNKKEKLVLHAKLVNYKE